MTQTAEALSRNIYDETRALYKGLTSKLGSSAYGFRILYGPPLVRAPLLFIGYQPGGQTQSAIDGLRDGEHDGWPTSCVYAHATWKLAARLRAVWGQAALQRSTGPLVIVHVFTEAPGIFTVCVSSALLL